MFVQPKPELRAITVVGSDEVNEGWTRGNFESMLRGLARATSGESIASNPTTFKAAAEALQSALNRVPNVTTALHVADGMWYVSAQRR